MEQKKIIDTVIKKYMDNDFPKEIQSEFQEWIMDTENVQEKDDALLNYMSSIDQKFDYQSYKEKLSKLNEAIDDRKRTRYLSTLKKYSFRAIAASLLIAVVAFSYYFIDQSTLFGEKTVYVTSPFSKGEFNLPDGSQVFLNASSKLVIPSDFSMKNRNVTLDGEGYFKIKKDSLHAFRVSSNLAQVKVLGTVFNMKAYSNNNYAEVVLVEGSVEVMGSSLSSPVVMQPNEKITINKTAQIEDVQISDYTSWTNQKIIIDNKSLENILINLEHRYNVEFVPSGNVDLTPHLTLVIKDEDLESILKQIALITTFKYDLSGEKVIYSTE